MIAHFPTPYEDELLYSVLARFQERMGYATTVVFSEAFGRKEGVPEIELPTRIDTLVSALPPGACNTPDRIIQEHTLLRFYGPFLPQRSYESILQAMKGNGSTAPQLRAGIIRGHIKPLTFLKTCPVCDRDNIAKHSETYWKRLHQIKGVEVCPIHSVFLEATDVPHYRLGSSRRYSTAQSAKRARVARAVDHTNHAHQLLVRIAESAAWLLDENVSPLGRPEITRRHREVLTANGHIRQDGQVLLSPLARSLLSCYTQDWLEFFNCELRWDGQRRVPSWLDRMFAPTNSDVAPLCHLILLAMFSVSAKEFFSSRPASVAPVASPGEAYFPCLNLLCPRYGELVIRESEVKRDQNGNPRIYLCPHCGHRSSRFQGGLVPYHVSNHGHLWEQRLRVLWSDKSKGLGAISKELKSSYDTVRCHAAKLRLPFPRYGTGRLAGVGFLKTFATRVARQKKKRLARASQVERKRAAWIAVRQKNPGASRTQLCRFSPRLYYWLLTYDRHWYEDHSPERRLTQRKKADWSMQDKDLARRVVTAADRIKRLPGNPRRVTVAAIAYELCLLGNFYSKRNRLPLTALALRENIESPEQFTLRRMRHTADNVASQTNISSGWFGQRL